MSQGQPGNFMTLWSHLVLLSQLEDTQSVVSPVPGEAADHGPLVPVVQQLTLKYQSVQSNHLAARACYLLFSLKELVENHLPAGRVVT